MIYQGSCHCGKVKYQADMTIDSVISCNCSICSKRGSLLAFTPAGNVKVSGEDNLTSYTFNKHLIKHQFCKTCGILPFGQATAPDGTPSYAINVRTFDNADFTQFPVMPFNGKSL